MKKSKHFICLILGMLVACMLSACTSTKEIEEYIEEDVEEDIYAVIKSEYEKVDFSGNFELGENVFHEEYLKLIQCNVPFVVPETGEEIYLNQLGQLDSFMLHSYELEALEYYYYDIDGDRISELGVTDGVNFICLFDYDEQNGQMVLWQDLCSTWYRVMGTGKIFWNNGGSDIVFYELDEQGNEKLSVYFYSEEFYNREKDTTEIRYMVALPQYSDEKEQSNISQYADYYDEGQQLYYFSVTKEEFDELTEEYFKAEQESKQNIKEVSHTYEEILGLLSENEYPYQMEKQVYSLKIFSDYFYELQNGVTRSTNNHEIYMEFLEERRSVDGMTVTDITVPTGEPEKRYFTEYTFADSDADGSDELHIRSERYYYIIDYENDDLSMWKSLHPRTELLNNGDYLYTHIGGAPLHHDYKYFRLNPKGEEVWSISYSWYDENENGEYDENDLYLMQDTDVLSYEEWEEVQENYLNVGTDRISWTVLNEKDNEKMYSYEIERAFELAQENRIQEVAAALSKSIGKWSVKELILPMAIGQDSTRSIGNGVVTNRY